MDYLYMGPSLQGFEWLLVLKCGLSHLTLLTPANTANTDVVLQAFQLWISLFGVPKVVFTDMGSHFVNRFLIGLAEALHIEHHITPVACSWVHGSVERLNRDILSVFRPLLSELALTHMEWPRLLSVVQSVLNSSPMESLRGLSPIEVFTGRPPCSALNQIVLEDLTLLPHPLSPDDIFTIVARVREALIDIHTDVAHIAERRLEANRRQQPATTVPVRFTVGDYVLMAQVKKRVKHSKLLCTWIGPFQLIEVIAPYVFQIKSIVDASTHVAHAARLLFYSDHLLQVTQQLVDHVARQGMLFSVDCIEDFRDTSHGIEVLVKWLGFSNIEASWEPLTAMFADVPDYVHRFLDTLPVADADRIRCSLSSMPPL
jgi:hypothetical protein